MFDLDGTLKAEAASEQFISSITYDGAAGWIAYGPEGEGDEIPWLRTAQGGDDELTWGDPLFHAPRRRDQWVGAGTSAMCG